MLSYKNYKNKVVGDLAWVIASPPLLQNINHLKLFFDKDYYFNEYNKFENKLRELDKDPTELTKHIEERNTHLLGKYFESLVEYWLRESNDKKLLAHNLQVFKGRNTIGEFDFVYRDLTDGKVYHLECAGKFYIAHKNISDHSNFIGPNSIDTLERKVKKIVDEQISLADTAEGKETLFVEGVNEKVIPKIFLKGYLFYYADLLFENIFIPPESSDPDHLKGWWISAKDIDYFFSRRKSEWIIVDRIDWISKVILYNTENVLSNSELIDKLKSYFKSNTYPLLIAELEEYGNYHQEISRGFVVANTWPNVEL